MLGTTRRPTPFGTPATRLHGGRIVLVLALLIGAAFAGWVWVFHKGTTLGKSVTESSLNPGWTAAQTQYTVEPKQEPLLPAPVDKYGEQIAKILAMLNKMNERFDTIEGRLTALEQRKPPTATVVKEAPKPPPPPKAPGSMLFVQHEVKEGVPVAKAHEYTLAPGSKLPAIVESQINSDVPGFFTAKVSTNVYDSFTGRHLLVSQGSTIVGRYHSEDLLYGNERVPTVSLTLSLSDGRSIDLGQAPVTDQLGTMGLTGLVDNHYGRLLAAVLIGGTLRAGTQALQVGLSNAAGAGPVAAGYSSVLNQAVSPRIGRALDTRPTITAFSGQIANILLIKELKLPAMWE